MSLFNFCTFSVGGCWGQPMLLFWKLVLIIKMSTSQDFKTTFKYNLTCIFLSLRAQLKKPLCPRTPCIWAKVKLKTKQKTWTTHWDNVKTLIWEYVQPIVHCEGLGNKPGACNLQLNSGKITNLKNVGFTTVLNWGVNKNICSYHVDTIIYVQCVS